MCNRNSPEKKKKETNTGCIRDTSPDLEEEKKKEKKVDKIDVIVGCVRETPHIKTWDV